MRWPERPPRGRVLHVVLVGIAIAAACRTATPEEGGPINLRSAAPEYYRALERRINGNWGPDRPGARGSLAKEYERSGGGIVMVSFSVGKTGEIVGDPGVEESSGSEFLDGEAIRAVTSAAPFPPLPAGVKTDRIDLLWRFEHIPTRRRSE